MLPPHWPPVVSTLVGRGGAVQDPQTLARRVLDELRRQLALPQGTRVEFRDLGADIAEYDPQRPHVLALHHKHLTTWAHMVPYAVAHEAYHMARRLALREGRAAGAELLDEDGHEAAAHAYGQSFADWWATRYPRS